jgi:hypothetical protein
LRLGYELHLSLITAAMLKKIADKSLKHKSFPHNLLLRDLVIQRRGCYSTYI